MSVWHTEAPLSWRKWMGQLQGARRRLSRGASCPFVNLRPVHVRDGPRSHRHLGAESKLSARLKVVRVA